MAKDMVRPERKKMTQWVSGERGKTAGSRPNPSLRECLLCLGFILGLILFGVLNTRFDDQAENRAFNALSAAQHLEAAKQALRLGLFSDGLRHVNAIAKGAPEASEATRLRDDLAAGKRAADLAAAKNEEELAALQQARIAQERETAKAAENARKAAIRDLQDNLKNLGYATTVGPSDKPEEIVITSKDFGDTDHRVRFLSFMRGRNSPAGGVCLAGVQTLRLKDAGWFGFNEAYSLDCFSSK
jgi:hypothetical protein